MIRTKSFATLVGALPCIVFTGASGDHVLLYLPLRCPLLDDCTPLLAGLEGMGSACVPKYFLCKASATWTNPIITGTSISGPMTAANAAPEWMPKTATATAMASSKLLLAAVKDKVVVLE